VRIEELREHLCSAYPGLCPLFSIEFGDGVLAVPPDALLSAATDLRDLGFDLLGMVTAVDWGDEFELVYRMRSRELQVGMFLKTRVPREDARIESVTSLWPGAEWHEREVYDLFGIVFEGHPDLRRILLPDDWEGHPLRKDYRDDRLIRRPDYA
jgi:NADH-quinone oxidoreductase subunit C